MRDGMALDPNAKTALRFLLGHLLVGVVAAAVFTVLLIATDAFGLKSLIFEQEDGWLAALLLLFGLVVTFGSLAMGIGVQGLSGRGPEDD